MAEFQEVMRQAKRMCKDHKECETCPASKHMEPFDECPLCGGIDAAEVENVVMQWAAENPEPVYPNWHEAWKQLFPDGHGSPCPAAYDIRYEWEKCGADCKGCKDRPIPADIAEKLGVKPLGLRKPTDEERKAAKWDGK